MSKQTKNFTIEAFENHQAELVDKFIDGLVEKLNKNNFKNLVDNPAIKKVYFSAWVNGLGDQFFLFLIFPEESDFDYKLFLQVDASLFHAANQFDDSSFVETFYTGSEYDGTKTYYLDITERFEDDSFFKQIESKLSNG